MSTELPCSECDRMFSTTGALSTHLRRTHAIRVPRKTDSRVKNLEGVTCKACGKEFASISSLRAHGSPDVCRARVSKGWKELQCQNPSCGKTFTKYLGPRGDRRGGKYCSRECAAASYERVVQCEWTSEKRTCPTCGSVFTPRQRIQKYCAHECVRGWRAPTGHKMGGFREKGGRGKQLKYTNRWGDTMSLNAEELRLAEYLDFLPFRWVRGRKGFPYTDLSGKARKFYPDFYVVDMDTYVEYKGWATEEMLHKMRDAQRVNSDLHLEIVVGDDPRYLHLGMAIRDLEGGVAELFKM